jgi:hypothetical protein
MWPVPKMVLGESTTLLCLPRGGRCGWASLPPAPASELWLTRKGTKPLDRCCLMLSHHTGRHGFRPAFWGMRSPQDGPSIVVFTAHVPNGVDSLWRSPPLLDRTYLMSELSWLLCMFLWRSCYVTRRRDEFQSCTIMPDSKWHRFSRTWLLVVLTHY